MKLHLYLCSAIVAVLVLQSCYVQQPACSTVQNVMQLEPGISLDSVNAILGIEPYDLISIKASGESIYLYKYRVEDLKRIPVLMKRNKGIPAEGKFKDLLVTVNPENLVLEINSLEEYRATRVKVNKLDPNSIIQAVSLLLTVTIPAILVFLSLE